jgi:hypothetical protein
MTMIYRLLPFSIIALTLAGLVSCDAGLTGNLKENQPPRTFLTVNEINLDQDNSTERRLVSQVLISWWGDDPDGYVVAFEYAITEREWVYTPETEGEVDWTRTERTDSVFVLPIPPGEKVADVRFTVRAIDNEGLRDPEGASVVFPIENSPPEVNIHRVATPQQEMEAPPDTTYHVASIGWTATDPDGDDNLSHFEVVMNDTLADWTRVPVDVSFLSFRITEPAGDQTSATVYLGRSFTRSDIVLDNIRMNSENTFYIRAVDNAEATSPIDSFTWFIKEQTSRVLLINDFAGVARPDAMARHKQVLQDLGVTQYDYMETLDGVASGGQKVPISRAFHRPVDPTLNQVLAEWDHIYWVSDDMDRNITYALRSTLDFFENGGTMFVNIPTKRLEEDDAIFNFLPFERMERVPPGGFVGFNVPRNARLLPVHPELSDTLTIIRDSRSSYPVFPAGDTRRFFDAEFRLLPFHDPNVDFSKLLVNGAPDNSIIYFGYQLERIEAGEGLNRTMRYFLQELNFPVD